MLFACTNTVTARDSRRNVHRAPLQAPSHRWLDDPHTRGTKLRILTEADGNPLALHAYANRLTKSSADWATSRQPWSIVRAWPRFGIFTISVTAELRRCRL